MGGHHDKNLNQELIEDSHYTLLGSVLGSKAAARKSIFYSYTKSINGFAALIDEDDVPAVSNLPGVLSLFPNRQRQLHTTESWRLLGLHNGNPNNPIIPKDSLWNKAKFGKDVIVTHLDTGVWLESASFHDEGLGPIPSRWKGFCQSGVNFSAANCNSKLIGARYFYMGHKARNGHFENGLPVTPRDVEGHGSHTLSTSSGNFVKNASLYGYAEGVAKGGAPHARVVAYKVCWNDSCADADILAAFEAGIDEGVDVFSVSLGSDPPLSDYFQDGNAIGSYHVVRLGKVVVWSAGNAGPNVSTVSNVAPWIIIVGASTTDRKIASSVSLGNKKTYMGESGSQFFLPEKKFYPLVSSEDVKASSANKTAGRLCYLGALDPKKV